MILQSVSKTCKEMEAMAADSGLPYRIIAKICGHMDTTSRSEMLARADELQRIYGIGEAYVSSFVRSLAA